MQPLPTLSQYVRPKFRTHRSPPNPSLHIKSGSSKACESERVVPLRRNHCAAMPHASFSTTLAYSNQESKRNSLSDGILSNGRYFFLLCGEDIIAENPSDRGSQLFSFTEEERQDIHDQAGDFQGISAWRKVSERHLSTVLFSVTASHAVYVLRSMSIKPLYSGIFSVESESPSNLVIQFQQWSWTQPPPLLNS